MITLSPEPTEDVVETLVLTSLALVITIGATTLQSNISLHHAMVAISLLTVLMLPLHFVEHWRVRSPGIFLAQQLRFILYGAFQIWTTANLACFGSHPELNHWYVELYFPAG